MDDAFITARAFTEALGAEIAYWRKRRGLARDDLADMAGISKSTMGRIERDGPKDVSDTWRLAAALNVPFVELVRRAEEAAQLGILQFDEMVEIVERSSALTDPDVEPPVRIAAKLDMDEPAAQVRRSEEDEAARAVDLANRRARDTRPTRKRAMQQMQNEAARDEDRKGKRS